MSRKKKKIPSVASPEEEIKELDALPTAAIEDLDELEQAIQEVETEPLERNDVVLDGDLPEPKKEPEKEALDEFFAAPQEYHTRAGFFARMMPFMIGILITGVVVGMGMSIIIVSQLLGAKDEADHVRHSFESIQESVSHLDFRGALTEFPKGQESIQALIVRIDRFRFLEWVPVIGSRVAETSKSLHILEKYFVAGERLLTIVQQIGDVIFTRGNQPFELYMRTLSRDDKAVILEAITKALPTIHGVQATLRLSNLEMDHIDQGKISGELSHALRETKAGGAYLLSLIDAWLPLAEVVPSFLGYPQEKTYLILLHDTSEVRATGGFISHYGILKLQHGEITYLKTDNVYNLDDRSTASGIIPLPDPFRRHFPGEIPQWYFRDSNWAPDFSESARQADLFYRLEGGNERIDGVIAATPEFVRALLQYTGSIRVQGREYTAENFMEHLQFEITEGNYRRGIEEVKRKEIFGELIAHIGEKLMELPVTRWLELYATIETRLNEKHILLYFNDSRLQAFARARNWTGEIRGNQGDYLMVVDTTFATLKTESVMDKRMSYTVREDPDGFLVARFDCAYTNRATYSDVTTRYRDWMRVYVPDGSTVISSSGFQSSEDPASKGTLEIARRYGKLELAGFFTVEPRYTKTLSIEYRLPDRIYRQVKGGSYSLLLQKQPGIANQRLDGHMNFIQPIESYVPLGFSNVKRSDHELDVFHDYRVDQEFAITLKKKEAQ